MNEKAIILTLLLALSLTACSPRRDTVNSSNNTPDESPEAAQTETSSQSIESSYQFNTLPGITTPEIEPLKIEIYDGTMGETTVFTDSSDIDAILNYLYELKIHTQEVELEPHQKELTFGSLYLVSVFDAVEADTPVYSVGLDPCRITVKGTKMGPYATDNAETVIANLLDIITLAHEAEIRE